MSLVGKKAPIFSAAAIINGEEIVDNFSLEQYIGSKEVVFFFYPKDFTFVCPTEIVEFNNNHDKFTALNTELYGASTDTEEVHLAWRNNDTKLADLTFPLISDTSKSLSKKLGILQPGSVVYRATFIVDPDGIIQWVNCNNDTTGRNVAEVLRALEATQNPGLTGCDWQPGDATL